MKGPILIETGFWLGVLWFFGFWSWMRFFLWVKLSAKNLSVFLWLMSLAIFSVFLQSKAWIRSDSTSLFFLRHLYAFEVIVGIYVSLLVLFFVSIKKNIKIDRILLNAIFNFFMLICLTLVPLGTMVWAMIFVSCGLGNLLTIKRKKLHLLLFLPEWVTQKARLSFDWGLRTCLVFISLGICFAVMDIEGYQFALSLSWLNKTIWVCVLALTNLFDHTKWSKQSLIIGSVPFWILINSF